MSDLDNPRSEHPGPPIVIIGPTAVGKSAVAMELARQVGNAELISADSMQVYRGMDVGTAKPTADEQAAVPHHLIDVVEPHEDFTLSQFQAAVFAALDDLAARGQRPIIVGGTGLYVRSIVDRLEIPGQYPEARTELDAETNTRALHERLVALDPTAAARMEPDNRRRVLRALEVTVGSGRPFSSFGPGLDAYPETDMIQIGLDMDRGLLDQRINTRYDVQMDEGFLDEVRRLHERPQGISRTAAQALGYKELLDHVTGYSTLDDALNLARKRTRRFARRQQRWFRRDPRIRWFEITPDTNLVQLSETILRDCH